MRPLLIEGMLASTEDPQVPWAVLVDSDQFGTDSTDEFKSPANKRLRNTVAHELTHSLAFRFHEFGVSLNNEKKRNQSNEDYVKEIERETESLSPLLLLCDRSIKNLTKEISINSIFSFRENHGVSNYILINRLNHLSPESINHSHKPLNNTAIGIYKDGFLEAWPIFYKFENNIVPEFILNAKRGTRVKLSEHFTNSEFILNGGTYSRTTAKVAAGTSANSNSRRLAVSIDLENGSKRGIAYINVIDEKKAETDPLDLNLFSETYD